MQKAFEAELSVSELERRKVVLLHGLGRSKFSMSFLGLYLASRDYKVYNYGYFSLRRDIKQQARMLREWLLRRKLQGEALNFVTHSLGSIILRRFVLDFHEEFRFARAVMLGPPNRGASIARYLKKKLPTCERILGPAFDELSNLEMESGANHLAIGIIAGGRLKESGISPFIKGDNDGIVSVEETELNGAADHLVVRGLHSFLMYQPTVIKQVIYFLDNGKFCR